MDLQLPIQREWLCNQLPVFSRLGKRQLRQFAKLAEFDEFAPGGFIIQAGSPYERTLARNRFKSNKRKLGPPDPDSTVPEADYVRTAVARQVGQETRVTLDPPTPRGETEVLEDQLWWARIIARWRDDRGVLVILRDALILGSKPGSREVLNPELIDRVAR